jgi:anthranilate synthase component 2
MVLVIDNYDSFTYNLVQLLGELETGIRVVRNDAASADELLAMRPDRVVISPGPGRPEQAGITLEVIARAGAAGIPVLGVCLGHQAIGMAFGAVVVRAPRPVHGKPSFIEHDGRGLFAGLADRFPAARYHSLVVSEAGFPPDLRVAARETDGNLVMGLRHCLLPIHGVQFHPESILTPSGRQMLRNFVSMNSGSPFEPGA